MTGQRLFLSPLRVPMPSIAARTNGRRRPAPLQQDGGLWEERLASSAQGGWLYQRQGRQRAQQQFIGHACSYSLHLQLIEDRKDPQVLVQGHSLIQGTDFPSSWRDPVVRLVSTPLLRLLYRCDTMPSSSSFRTSLLVYHLLPVISKYLSAIFNLLPIPVS